MHKPIKIAVRRPEPEPADFVQKIPLGTTTEEEAAEEDSVEPLERHAPTRGREQRAKEPAPPVRGTEQRAKEPAPTVRGTQQRAKGPTPITKEVEEQEESRAAKQEAALDQRLSDVASEPIFPDLGSEQVPEPETSARKPEGRRATAGTTERERAKHPD